MSSEEADRGKRLVPLPVGRPAGPAGLGEADPPGGLEALLDEAFSRQGPLGETYAVVALEGGAIVAERYGGALPHFERPPEVVGPETRLLSWSMAKSMLHSAVGVLLCEGLVSLSGPAPVPEWSDPADPRHAISLQDMLEMRDGLAWSEDYVDAASSDVIEMLFGKGRLDVAGFAASRPARHAPGARFSYSSGTSNIIAGVLCRLLGGREPAQAWLRSRLFDPIGASSVELTFDEAGTWIASSFVHATARDYARFGQLQLQDGVWGDARVLPEGWVDHGRRPRSVDEDGSCYGAHWWVDGDEWGTFRASGYEGQTIVVSPGLDVVLVRLGKTPEESAEAVGDWTRKVLSVFSAAASP